MKPVVRYIDLGRLVIGEPARVLLSNHPSIGEFRRPRWVWTSTVQTFTEGSDGPVFETLHTIYVPLPSGSADLPATAAFMKAA